MRYRAGDRVVVRDVEEILATLDEAGELERMPFMAEMLEHCGREFRIAAVAHKTCDTIHKTGGRRVRDAVHLEGVRCNGSLHGGCQAGCLVFWKTEWLRPAPSNSAGRPDDGPEREAASRRLARAGVRNSSEGPLYSCQATRLFAASEPLAWWDLRQYGRDLQCGNVGAGRLARVAVLRALHALCRLPIAYRLTRALYDRVHRWLTGRPSPYAPGLLPARSPTPTASIGLQPGEWVRVRSHDEIRATTTELNMNRGMRFDPEMVRYCNGTYRVAGRVERLIEEGTGRMLHMKSPCIVLDGVVCTSEYSDRKIFCPRAITPYFREIWLERSSPPRAGTPP